MLRLKAAIFLFQLIFVLPRSAGAQDLISLDQIGLDQLSPWENSITGFGPDVALGDFWNATFPVAESTIYDDYDTTGSNKSSSVDTFRMLRGAKDFWLRVMPLGASITEGVGSTDRNGYRKWIRQQLRWKGWKVNMVGSSHIGTMKDRDNEGHPGWIIDQVPNKTINGVRQAWDSAKSLKPNLVLLNVGTNDCGNGLEDGAETRMGDFIESIFKDVPGIVLILSTLVPSPNVKDCAARLSEKYRQLVPNYPRGKIALADFNAAMNPNTMISSDNVHPNDLGYKFMASVWWDAISKVEGNIVKPLDNGKDDSPGDVSCAKNPGGSRGPIVTQSGSGKDDGIYVHKSQGRGVLKDGRIQKPSSRNESSAIPSHIWFAQLTEANNVDRGAALDDWIRINPRSASDGKNEYWFRENLGGGSFATSVQFDVKQNCDGGPNYAWADFSLADVRFWQLMKNNDGLGEIITITSCGQRPRADHSFSGVADFWCIGQDAKISVSINKGTRPPTVSMSRKDRRCPFEYLGNVLPAQGNFKASDVRIADIDGDGRADVCFVNDNGDIACSRNGGQGTNYNWQGFHTVNGLGEIIFTGKGNGSKDGIVLADLNGDFRDDWMLVGDTGQVDTWINQRGTGTGIAPQWSASGTTHVGVNVAGARDRIKFGRIYGSGRRDYIYLKEENDYYDMMVFENLGAGGTKLKGSSSTGKGLDVHGLTYIISLGDGSFYCDMTGSGSADYVWIYMDGHADSSALSLNIHDPPNWGHKISIQLNVPGPRVGIHLADWDGDGRCDVLVQTKSTGALTMWKNNYDKDKQTITFTNQGVVSGSATCSQGWGVSIFDRGMRIADIDGDNRADILCVEPAGRITAWLNKDTGLQNVGQIKASEGWDRANIRFADVEASGRADLLHVDKYTGATVMFKNDGYRPNDVATNKGSTFHWTHRGVVYSPIDRGENITDDMCGSQHFVNLGGLGRADLHHVWPNDNKAETFFNECSQGGGLGGDDEPVSPGYVKGLWPPRYLCKGGLRVKRIASHYDSDNNCDLLY
ncbi:carbohydrate esterase family 3 protein [Penicillium paradoxum]|uniref:carbohydrate esterase family 3 protein n=1 Tax=Penicillium paradoxum TaxID=176176 RepID=UPI002546EC9B|nr:carbohydrate esterase family 3 protein [Penicillium paradoxum]KAJ5794948.1 carbohydrate esterase family 3 protein [Penicillium paradoxum]